MCLVIKQQTCVFLKFFTVSKVKVNTDIAVRNRNHLTATVNHMPYGITQCYLSPGSVDFPAFTPTEDGTRFSDLGGCKAELTWVVVTSKIVYLPNTVTYLKNNQAVS